MKTSDGGEEFINGGESNAMSDDGIEIGGALFVQTQKELAASLSVSVRQINRWLKLPGFPAKTSDGWPVADVVSWLQANGRTLKGGRNSSLHDEERKWKIEKLKAQVSVINKSYWPVSECKVAMGQAVFNLMREILARGPRLVQLLNAKPIAEGLEIYESEVREVFSNVAQMPWDKEQRKKDKSEK